MTDTKSYFESYARGMSQAIQSDPIVTSLFVGSVAIGKRRGWLSGVATFFLGYAAMGEITNLAMTIGKSTQSLARVLATRQMPKTMPDQV